MDRFKMFTKSISSFVRFDYVCSFILMLQVGNFFLKFRTHISKNVWVEIYCFYQHTYVVMAIYLWQHYLFYSKREICYKNNFIILYLSILNSNYGTGIMSSATSRLLLCFLVVSSVQRLTLLVIVMPWCKISNCDHHCYKAMAPVKRAGISEGEWEHGDTSGAVIFCLSAPYALPLWVVGKSGLRPLLFSIMKSCHSQPPMVGIQIYFGSHNSQ